MDRALWVEAVSAVAWTEPRELGHSLGASRSWARALCHPSACSWGLSTGGKGLTSGLFSFGFLGLSGLCWAMSAIYRPLVVIALTPIFQPFPCLHALRVGKGNCPLHCSSTEIDICRSEGHDFPSLNTRCHPCHLPPPLAHGTPKIFSVAISPKLH